MLRIAVIPGDGIGPEVVREALPLLPWARARGRDLDWEVLPHGADRFLSTGEALSEPVSRIVEAVRITLERCPPELSADLVDSGVVLAGGGALLRGLDRLIGEETKLPVHIAEDPLSAVAEGTGKALQEIEFLRAVAASDRPRA